MNPTKQAFRDANGWREDYVSREEKNGITQEYLLKNFDYKEGYLYWNPEIKVHCARKNGLSGWRNDGRWKMVLGNKHYFAARLISLYHHGFLAEIIDHEDGDSSNNRIENLRPASYALNNVNKKKRACKPNTSIYFGIWKSGNSWTYEVRINGYREARSFPSEIKAALEYNKAAVRVHGEFAKLNIIKP